METLGRIVLAALAILLVIVVPSLVVGGGWCLVGFVPPTVREAIMTLVPYGIAAVAWVCLVWICAQIAAAILD